MTTNFKKRAYTSLGLIFILSFMFINIYILAYLLMVIGIFSILEFSKLILFLKRVRIYKFILLNFVFSIYIFFIFSSFLILSFFTHLKILLFIILFTCVFSDIGGYIFGKIIKGPKLTRISPKKTISGSIGSILLSILFLSFSIYYLTKNFELELLIAGFLISASCQIGDLFFSFLKRVSKIKDTGNILPGHGGVLDRIDGILLGVPLGFIIMIMIY